jgi:hypothetical protein
LNYQPRVDPVKRFWSKVEKTDLCWIWRGQRNHYGYGAFSFGGTRRKVGAHRFAYELLVGPIPEGLTIDHLCRNRACVNPDHLEPVSMYENLMRSPIAPQAVNARKTHCKHGHEFTPENTYWRKDRPGRRCVRCNREQTARYKQRKLATA